LKTGILAFAFGAPETILSNQRIASIASKKASELGVSVYSQLDIGRIINNTDIEVEITKEKPGKPPSTLRLVQGAVEWARRKAITDIWIVAAKPHLWRCIRDLTYTIQEAKLEIKIHICEEIEQYPENEWFCSDSTQKRTQSRKNWERREWIIKLIPFFIYKLIAS